MGAVAPPFDRDCDADRQQQRGGGGVGVGASAWSFVLANMELYRNAAHSASAAAAAARFPRVDTRPERLRLWDAVLLDPAAAAAETAERAAQRGRRGGGCLCLPGRASAYEREIIVEPGLELSSNVNQVGSRGAAAGWDADDGGARAPTASPSVLQSGLPGAAPGDAGELRRSVEAVEQI